MGGHLSCPCHSSQHRKMLKMKAHEVPEGKRTFTGNCLSVRLKSLLFSWAFSLPLFCECEKIRHTNNNLVNPLLINGYQMSIDICKTWGRGTLFEIRGGTIPISNQPLHYFLLILSWSPSCLHSSAMSILSFLRVYT